MRQWTYSVALKNLVILWLLKPVLWFFFLNVIQRILMSHFDIAAVWPYVTFQSPKGALSQNEESEVRASWFSLQPSGR